MLAVRFAHVNCVLRLLLQELLFFSLTTQALQMTKTGSIPVSCLSR